MPFPQEFPKVALATLLGYANGSPPELKTAALAAYELEGYLLGLYFGEVEYPKGVNLVKLLELAASPEFAKAQEAIKTFASLRASGVGPVKALLKILIQYGPQILALVLKLIALAE
jgi:hypothetical protein